MLIKVVASGPGGVLPSSNYILTHKEEKEKERDFPFSLQKNTPSSSVMYIYGKTFGLWRIMVPLTFIFQL